MTNAAGTRLLEDKIAVISGGGGGIGAATSELFAAHGATVVIAEIDPELASATEAAIRAAGGRAQAVRCDVTDAAQVSALRDGVLADHGRCDVLVNNVGHYFKPTAFMRSTEEHWDALDAINFRHILRMTQAFAPSMIEQRSGSIVNVSSVEGLRGYPADPVYAAYKAAVVHFTKSLAVDLGRDGVRVNGIGPDVTQSIQIRYDLGVPPEQQHLWPMWVPVGRMGVADDQAAVALFLASDLSRFVTGHTIPTDGGTGAAGGWFRSTHRPGWTNRPIAP